MTDDHHHHDHDHSELSETELRVRALETILTEKGYVDPAALDRLDRDLREENRAAQRRARRRQGLERSGLSRLLDDATRRPRSPTRLCRPPGRAHGGGREHARHATTWSCAHCAPAIPWPVLGLPPVWYKSAPYRSRAVTDPRGVLRDFGVTLPDDDQDPRLGFHRRDPLPRAADAARRAPRAGARSNSPSSSPATA